MIETLTKSRAGRPKRAVDGETDTRLVANQIFEATLTLIDEKGISNFNIRDLAATLGVTPAAIYWHVPNRDALISGAVNLAIRNVAGALTARGQWQNRLRKLIRAFRDALRAHPKLAPAVASELSYNASFDCELLDRVVRVLEDAGLKGAALVEAFNVVIAAMCGFVTLELSTAPSDKNWEMDCRQHMNAIDGQRFPSLGRHLHALENNAFLLRWSSGIEKPLDDAFEAWIDVVVMGLERRAGKVVDG
jgi:AcrR family transcriptional regulator